MADRIRKGDRQAFEIIYERYHRQLFYLARKYVKDQELAEDALQEVFVKLWVKRRTIDPGRSLKSFLFTMMRNHILNVVRDHKKRIAAVYRLEEESLPEHKRTDDDLLYQEYQLLVRQGMKELPVRRREIFELKLSGHSNSQIADMLLISVNTVKAQYYHGKKFIRTWLERHADLHLLILFVIKGLLD